MRSKHTSKDRIKSSGISQEMVAKWFDYSTPESFRNSSARDRILDGIEKALSHYHQYILEKLDE